MFQRNIHRYTFQSSFPVLNNTKPMITCTSTYFGRNMNQFMTGRNYRYMQTNSTPRVMIFCRYMCTPTTCKWTTLPHNTFVASCYSCDLLHCTCAHECICMYVHIHIYIYIHTYYMYHLYTHCTCRQHMYMTCTVSCIFSFLMTNYDI